MLEPEKRMINGGVDIIGERTYSTGSRGRWRNLVTYSVRRSTIHKLRRKSKSIVYVGSSAQLLDHSSHPVFHVPTGMILGHGYKCPKFANSDYRPEVSCCQTKKKFSVPLAYRDKPCYKPQSFCASPEPCRGMPVLAGGGQSRT